MGISPSWSLTRTDARVASRKLSNATKSFAAKSPSRREVVYSASSSVSGLNTSTCTAGSEAHHGEVEASSDDDARGRGVARARRAARRDAPLARVDEPLFAAHARVVDIAAGSDVQRGRAGD